MMCKISRFSSYFGHQAYRCHASHIRAHPNSPYMSFLDSCLLKLILRTCWWCSNPSLSKYRLFCSPLPRNESLYHCHTQLVYQIRKIWQPSSNAKYWSRIETWLGYTRCGWQFAFECFLCHGLYTHPWAPKVYLTFSFLTLGCCSLWKCLKHHANSTLAPFSSDENPQTTVHKFIGCWAHWQIQICCIS